MTGSPDHQEQQEGPALFFSMAQHDCINVHNAACNANAAEVLMAIKHTCAWLLVHALDVAGTLAKEAHLGLHPPLDHVPKVGVQLHELVVHV